MTTTDEDRKLKELMLYIAKKSEGDPTFGAVKLNKILWAADFIAYGKTGQAITGQEYFRLPNGPAPRKLKPVRGSMLAAKECAIQRRDHHGRQQQRMIALRDPDLSDFSGEHIAIVDEVLSRLHGRSAAEVSEWSHRFPGWKAAEDRETIPYSTIFVSSRKLTEREREYGGGLQATCGSG